VSCTQIFNISLSILSFEIFIVTYIFKQVYTFFYFQILLRFFVRTVSYSYNCQYFISFRDRCFIEYLLCASNKVVPSVLYGVCLLKLYTHFLIRRYNCANRVTGTLTGYKNGVHFTGGYGTFVLI
jgi:hypothetical protein